MNTDRKCYACEQAIPDGAEAYGAEVGQEWSYLCPTCWGKVARGGRTPRQTIEAILFFHCDDDVAGPDDPLDHEDYRDLERLGLWPDED